MEESSAGPAPAGAKLGGITMNIIVLIFDTLRYDYVGANGNEWIETPHMDELLAKSWVFDRSFAASYPTIPHRTDVITGKYGSPIFPWRPLRHDHVTFPELLGQNGYCTQLINDTPHLVNGGHNFDWPFHAWTPIRGAEVDRPWIDQEHASLDNFRPDPLFDGAEKRIVNPGYWPTYARSNRKRKQNSDWHTGRLFLTASRWLEENATRKNFLLWVDSFDPHEPWDVPPEFALKYDKTPGYDGSVDPRMHWARNDPGLSEAAKNRIRALYAAEVTWVDSWLGVLLDALHRTGLDKETAIVLTADHGTNVGERGKFGKGFPIREQEAHTPLAIHVPDGGSGRSSVIVQPQDIFATIMSIAGLPVPDGIDSHDVLALARDGTEAKDGPRKLAISGHAPDESLKDRPAGFFSACDGKWYLVAAVKPEDSELYRLGSLDNVAAEHAGVVARLHAAGIDEIERRGADPRLTAWLKSHGRAAFPTECVFWDGYPGPKGFGPYFRRLYEGV